MRALKHWLSLLMALTRFRLSIFVTFSAATGFMLSHQGITWEMFPMLLAIFLLASGACGLNQYQERREDQRMERTKNRPIPSGRLSPASALKISLLMITLGLLILLAGRDEQVLILGLFAVIWYNGIYTPLKKRTPFAAVPGALVGAIPPAIGWSAGGGHLFDPQLLAISFFFYIWQVPHFWILHFHLGRDYGKGGFPALTRIFTQAQFNRILFIWVFATGVASFFTPWFGILKSPLIIGGLFGIGGWLVWKALRLLSPGYQYPYGPSIFKSLSTYILLVMLCFSLDSLTPVQIHSFLF
jgi:protoheme IX farnesyltransferase